MVGFLWTRVLPRSKWKMETDGKKNYVFICILKNKKQDKTIIFFTKKGEKRNMYCQKISLPVVKASFILIAQNGGSAEGGRVPRSYELKAIRKKGAMAMS